jgi:hypothetical protein
VVGLSRSRYERFEGLALDEHLADTDSTPWTGNQIIDIASGQCVQWFRIDGMWQNSMTLLCCPVLAAPSDRLSGQ